MCTNFVEFNPIIEVYNLVFMVHSLRIFLDELGSYIFNVLWPNTLLEMLMIN